VNLQEVRSLHAYNSWATNRVFDLVVTLPTQEYLTDLKSSHGGIHGTFTHLVSAEKTWLARWLGEQTEPLQAGSIPDAPTLQGIWEKIGFDTARWLGGMTDKRLQETFTMKTARGEAYTHVYWQAFLHLVNHGSYHRGQIITMLRQTGHDAVSTDLIRFYRETGKKA
jgi:uncharacterized damage-inducible protein DinB